MKNLLISLPNTTHAIIIITWQQLLLEQCSHRTTCLNTKTTHLSLYLFICYLYHLAALFAFMLSPSFYAFSPNMHHTQQQISYINVSSSTSHAANCKHDKNPRYNILWARRKKRMDGNRVALLEERISPDESFRFGGELYCLAKSFFSLLSPLPFLTLYYLMPKIESTPGISTHTKTSILLQKELVSVSLFLVLPAKGSTGLGILTQKQVFRAY